MKADAGLIRDDEGTVCRLSDTVLAGLGWEVLDVETVKLATAVSKLSPKCLGVCANLMLFAGSLPESSYTEIRDLFRLETTGDESDILQYLCCCILKSLK